MSKEDFDYLFIAEKPTLAEAVAEARAEELGTKTSKGDGFWFVGKDRVTWLNGHMYGSAKPEAYGEQWKTWSIDNLPIEVPWNGWKRVVPPPPPPDANGRQFPSKTIQLNKIANLLRNATNIVNVGDAGREGQLLVDEVLEEAGLDPFAPNVLRLWVDSMTRKDMLAALAIMKPNKTKYNLFNSALCRQRVDWLHGMNMTTLYSKLAELSGTKATINVGRVMTPTLKLVVDRDRERLRFKPVDHYLPKITFSHVNGNFNANWVIPQDYEGLDSEGRLVDKKVAEQLCAQIDGKTGKITAYKSETKFTAPPLPYSLSALQAECNSLGLTANQTLEIAQSLYETHKITTYPRSDSRHLKLSLLPEAPGIIKALTQTKELGECAAKADLTLKSAAWDDSKTSEHHGIIPTSEFSLERFNRLSDIEREVFLLIAQTFVAQFFPPYKYRSLSADISCEGEKFKASGKQVIDYGWEIVYGAKEKKVEEGEEQENAQTLPTMVQNDPVTAQGSQIGSKRTSPPPAFNDGSLIIAMANVHRFETNPEIKKRLKETAGIGTEATRAATIEKLLGTDHLGKVRAKNPMLERKGKTGLQSTEFGRSVIDMLPDEITGAGLTALWEGMLGEVEQGVLDPQVFMQLQSQSILERIEASKDNKVLIKGVRSSVSRPLPGDGETCKKCNKGVMKTQEVTVTKDGPNKGKKIKLLACTNYPECKNTEFETPKIDPIDGDGKECEVCHQGVMKTREITITKDGPNKGKKMKILACSRYPDCKHSEFPQPKIDPLPGDGLECEVCHQGIMKTREFTSNKEGPNKGKKFKILACSRYPECKNSAFPDRPKVEPIEGDGKQCPKCSKGHLITKEVTSKKPGANFGKKFKLLGCDQYPACDYSEFPQSGNKLDSSTKVTNPLPGEGKTCEVCKTGVMKTKEYKDKTGVLKRMLGCSNYPTCKNVEWDNSNNAAGKNAGSSTKTRK